MNSYLKSLEKMRRTYVRTRINYQKKMRIVAAIDEVIAAIKDAQSPPSVKGDDN